MTDVNTFLTARFTKADVELAVRYGEGRLVVPAWVCGPLAAHQYVWRSDARFQEGRPFKRAFAYASHIGCGLGVDQLFAIGNNTSSLPNGFLKRAISWLVVNAADELAALEGIPFGQADAADKDALQRLLKAAQPVRDAAFDHFAAYRAARGSSW